MNTNSYNPQDDNNLPTGHSANDGHNHGTSDDNADVTEDGKQMTDDGTPLPSGHSRGDGHDHDGDGKPSVDA